MQLVDKLTVANLGDVRKAPRSKTYRRAIRPGAIPKFIFRFFAILVALASIAAASLVGALSYGCYGAAKLLGRFRPLRGAYQFLSEGVRPVA
jgi:hypothetical protein